MRTLSLPRFERYVSNIEDRVLLPSARASGSCDPLCGPSKPPRAARVPLTLPVTAFNPDRPVTR